MPTTPTFALPYPSLSDTADVPRDIQALAVKLDGLALVPAVVTALPGTPVDGQEVYYQVDAANGIYWHLRYRAASASAYKWEFLGGSPLAVESLANSTLAATPANAWGVLAAPISLTLPLAGDYDVLHVGNWRNNTAAAIFQLGERLGAGGPDPVVGEYASGSMSPAGFWAAITHRRRLTGRPAASVVAETFLLSPSGDVSRQAGRLEVTPVRVG